MLIPKRASEVIMPELLLAVAVILIFVAVVSLIEHQVKVKGSLIVGAATPRMRLLALLLGIVFAALFIGELISSDSIHVMFPLLAVALIGYSLGAGALLRNLQGEQRTDTTSQATSSSLQTPGEPGGETLHAEDSVLPINRIGRLLFILGIGVALAAVLIYAAMQAAAHPDQPLSWVFIIGVIALIVAVRLRNWLGLISRSKTSAAVRDRNPAKVDVSFADVWECDVCGARVDANATACPACGTQFES